MIIRNLLVLLIFVGVGFGASVAQSDIFVRQSPKAENSNSKKTEETQKKKSIFLRPFSKNSKRKHAALKNRYGAKLNTDGVLNKMSRDMTVLAYWQKQGRKPQGIEEMRAYGSALRAANVVNMLAERNKILPGLINKQRKRFDTVQKQLEMQAPDLEAVDAANALISAALRERQGGLAQAVYTGFGGQASSAVKASATKKDVGVVRRSVSRAMPVYRRTDDADASKSSSGVYKNYR
jgi:hypothetical protein